MNEYQLKYNKGEDTILAIDIIITIVTIIKGIIKLAKLLPKFTKWIDEVLARNGKGIVRGKLAFGKITRAIMKREIPKNFLEALKKMGKSEDEILEYYTNYHNDNNYIFLNGIQEIITKNKFITTTDAFALWSYTTNQPVVHFK